MESRGWRDRKITRKAINWKIERKVHDISTADADHVDGIDFSVTSANVKEVVIKGVDLTFYLQSSRKGINTPETRNETTDESWHSSESIMMTISKLFHPYHDVNIVAEGYLTMQSRYHGAPGNRVKKSLIIVLMAIIALFALLFIIMTFALLRSISETGMNAIPWDQAPLMLFFSLMFLGLTKMTGKQFLLTFFSVTELSFTTACMVVKKRFRRWTLESWVFPKQSLVAVITDHGRMTFVFFGGKTVTIRIGESGREHEVIRDVISALFSHSFPHSFSLQLGGSP